MPVQTNFHHPKDRWTGPLASHLLIFAMDLSSLLSCVSKQKFNRMFACTVHGMYVCLSVQYTECMYVCMYAHMCVQCVCVL